jgi:hypothetical protein
MPLPRITHKRRFVQGILIAAALLLMTLLLAAALAWGVVDRNMIHVTDKSHPPEKIVLQLLCGGRPAGSVPVSP